MVTGRPLSSPVDMGGIAGRTPLTADVREQLPAVLWGGSIRAVGPGGTSAFVTPHDTVPGPALDPEVRTGVPAFTEPPPSTGAST